MRLTRPPVSVHHRLAAGPDPRAFGRLIRQAEPRLERPLRTAEPLLNPVLLRLVVDRRQMTPKTLGVSFSIRPRHRTVGQQIIMTVVVPHERIRGIDRRHIQILTERHRQLVHHHVSTAAGDRQWCNVFHCRRHQIRYVHVQQILRPRTRGTAETRTGQFHDTSVFPRCWYIIPPSVRRNISIMFVAPRIARLTPIPVGVRHRLAA